MTSQRTRYRSAVDAWIGFLLLVGPGLAAAMAVRAMAAGQGEQATTLAIVALATAVTTLAFAIPCRYRFDADELSIRCGILSWRVPYDQITDVRESGSWLSGPALSLRRVRIQTRSGQTHLISPVDRESFIEQLQATVSKAS